MRLLEQPGLGPGQVPRHVGVGQCSPRREAMCLDWLDLDHRRGLGMLAIIYYLSLNLRPEPWSL